MLHNYDAWKINESLFPTRGAYEEQLKFCIGYAILAPSSHNTQPWRFEIKDSTIYLSLDWSRTIPYGDRKNQEAYISIGCALENLLLALKRFSFAYEVSYFPESFIADAIIIRTHKIKKKKHDELFNYLIDRVTNRFPPSQRKMTKQAAQMIQQVDIEPGTGIEIIIDEKKKKIIADIMEHAINFAFGDVVFKTELSHWIRSNYTQQHDGIPLFDSGLPDILTIIGPYLVKNVPSSRQSRQDKNLILASQALAIFTIGTDDRIGWVKTGQSFQRFSLLCTKYNLFTAPMAGIIEHESSKQQLKKAINIFGSPSFFCRVAYVNRIPHHSPRRTLEDVMV
ncbi:hypothetical protein KC726_02845 [Candidatus Woesebacteria bacterium]|nr:hypothetical protein [Candidatus Woesebacteria bacterium]